jgi:hypothetical protein
VCQECFEVTFISQDAQKGTIDTGRKIARNNHTSHEISCIMVLIRSKRAHWSQAKILTESRRSSLCLALRNRLEPFVNTWWRVIPGADSRTCQFERFKYCCSKVQSRSEWVTCQLNAGPRSASSVLIVPQLNLTSWPYPKILLKFSSSHFTVLGSAQDVILNRYLECFYCWIQYQRDDDWLFSTHQKGSQIPATL